MKVGMELEEVLLGFKGGMELEMKCQMEWNWKCNVNWNGCFVLKKLHSCIYIYR